MEDYTPVSGEAQVGIFRLFRSNCNQKFRLACLPDKIRYIGYNVKRGSRRGGSVSDLWLLLPIYEHFSKDQRNPRFRVSGIVPLLCGLGTVPRQAPANDSVLCNRYSSHLV